MATRAYPLARHDAQPWRPTDSSRAAMGGDQLKARFCVLYLNVDWMEVATTLGMPSWSDGIRPCYTCNALRECMCELDMVDENSAGNFRENLEDEYYTACERCEVRVELTQPQHSDVCALLRYDKRDDGLKGLALRQSVLSVPGLNAGMRLEPSPSLRDVADFFTMSVFPVQVIFWNVALETLSRHRNPLFDMTLGITPYRVLNADLLHCLYLGVFNVFVGAMIWTLMLSGIWCTPQSNFDDRVKIGVIVFKQRLDAWYRARRQAGEKNLTSVSDLTKNMIGDQNDFKCTFKGAECWYVLRFLLAELQLAGLSPMYVRAGQYLERLINLWNCSDWRLTDEQIRESWLCFRGFIACTRDEPLLNIPKKHQFFHLLRRLRLSGNPMMFTCWKWEALNKPLKRCCRNVSQASFELTVLNSMGRLLATCDL
jgi:hypothetical protein